jgi:N-acetylmuramoyl-L-alanine amidase
MKKQECPNVNTKSDTKKISVLIYSVKISENSELIQKIGKELVEKLKSNFENAVYSSLEEAKIKSKDFDLILGIKFNLDKKERNIITSDVFALASKDTRKKSEKLACNIINNLIDKNFPITSTDIKVSEIVPIKEKDKINVLLGLGNIENEDWIDMLKDRDQFQNIMNSLSNTIINFYENEK